MLMLVVLENWHITSVDIKTAFLYEKLNEELFMEQPEGFSKPSQEHKVLCLKCAIYGLKQAALKWWEALDEFMAALGFKCLLLDSGVFIYISKGKGTALQLSMLTMHSLWEQICPLSTNLSSPSCRLGNVKI